MQKITDRAKSRSRSAMASASFSACLCRRSRPCFKASTSAASLSRDDSLAEHLDAALSASSWAGGGGGGQKAVTSVSVYDFWPPAVLTVWTSCEKPWLVARLDSSIHFPPENVPRWSGLGLGIGQHQHQANKYCSGILPWIHAARITGPTVRLAATCCYVRRWRYPQAITGKSRATTQLPARTTTFRSLDGGPLQLTSILRPVSSEHNAQFRTFGTQFEAQLWPEISFYPPPTRRMSLQRHQPLNGCLHGTCFIVQLPLDKRWKTLCLRNSS